MPPEICFRQYYLPAFQNTEHQATLCQMQAECNELFAEGWALSHEVALPGGREVLFTFQRTADEHAFRAMNAEAYEQLRKSGADTNMPIEPRKPGRPRRQQESESTPDGL